MKRVEKEFQSSHELCLQPPAAENIDRATTSKFAFPAGMQEGPSQVFSATKNFAPPGACTECTFCLLGRSGLSLLWCRLALKTPVEKRAETRIP